jgi:hypothetical protein
LVGREVAMPGQLMPSPARVVDRLRRSLLVHAPLATPYARLAQGCPPKALAAVSLYSAAAGDVDAV